MLKINKIALWNHRAQLIIYLLEVIKLYAEINNEMV